MKSQQQEYSIYKNKYNKYKAKYLSYKRTQLGGDLDTNNNNTNTNSMNGWDAPEFTNGMSNSSIAREIKSSDAGQKNIIKATTLDEMSKKYLIGKKLGAGAYGVTYLGTRLLDNKNIAIKQQTMDNDNADVSLLSSEIEALTLANSNNCADVMILYEVSYDEEHNQMFFIMELIGGSDLEHVIPPLGETETQANYQARVKNIWPNEAEFIKNVVDPLVRGIRCLHKNNIAHRDIKPANVMYDSTLNKAKIIDLGKFQHLYFGYFMDIFR